MSATWPCLLTTLEDTPSRIFPASIRIGYAPTIFIDRSLLLLPENTRVCAVVATRRKIENQLSTTPTIRSLTFFTFNLLSSVGASLLAWPGHTLLLAAHVLVDDRGRPHEVLWTGHHKQVCKGWNVKKSEIISRNWRKSYETWCVTFGLMNMRGVIAKLVFIWNMTFIYAKKSGLLKTTTRRGSDWSNTSAKTSITSELMKIIKQVGSPTIKIRLKWAHEDHEIKAHSSWSWNKNDDNSKSKTKHKSSKIKPHVYTISFSFVNCATWLLCNIVDNGNNAAQVQHLL